MLKNFLNETANLGTTTKPGKAAKATYQGQTVTDMRNDLVSRAQSTIDALNIHEGGALRAPMARSVRNGITVKIGYGKRNVGFFDGKGEDRVSLIPDRYFGRDEVFIAAAYLQKIVNLVNAGEFDELLAQALAKMAAKFTQKEDEEQPTLEEEPKFLSNNVTQLANAA